MALPAPVAAVRRGVRGALAELAPGATVLVGCSGGADSTALLAAAVAEGHRRGLRVVGGCVDHGLQPGSTEHAAVVVRRMRGIGVDEAVAAPVRVELTGAGPEAAARQARYAVLDELAERFGAAVVLLGHTRDDQAETVLLGLARGSGGRAIAGMRRSFGRYRRPLLDVTRAETRAACAAGDLPVWSDPHNEDPRFTRVRVRTRVLPVLEEELGPGVAATLARTADQLRADTAYLDELAAERFDSLRLPHPSSGASLDVESCLPRCSLAARSVGELPDPVRTRVLRLAALAAGSPGAELFFEHVRAMDRLVTDWHGQRWVDLPGHLRCRRRDGVLQWEVVHGGLPGEPGRGEGG